MALPIRLGVLRALVKEISVSGASDKPLVVGGARELAGVLRKELGRDAKPGAVRADDEPKGGAVYVYVLGRDPTEADEAALKRARRARVPIVAVAAGRLSDDVTIPYVLATDVVRLEAGQGFPVEAIANLIAGAAGGGGCAARGARAGATPRGLRAARGGVRAEERHHRRRRVHPRRRLARAGAERDPADSPARAGVRTCDRPPRARCPRSRRRSASASACARVARELLDFVPVAGWAVKGAVAYAGTRALGEAAVRRLEVGAPGGH